jgi:hypothetical protein
VYRSRRTKKKKKNKKTADSVSLPAVARSKRKCPLAMSAAVSASTVEATAAGTVESATDMGSATGAAGIAASRVVTGVATTIGPASITSRVASSADETAAVVAVSIVSGSTVVAAMAPSPVIPRTCADKYSAREPLRTVKAVRRTGIGIVRIVAVGANRRPVHVARPWVGIALVITLVGITLVVPDRNSCLNLRLRVSKRRHQHRQQRNISQITHMNPLGSSPAECLIGTRKPSKNRGLEWAFLSFPPATGLYVFER